MNRIYQGRVTRIEELRTDGTESLIDDCHTVLWKHHQLFQDAVNYYAFVLAVMAEGMKEKDNDGVERPTAMARFAEQVLGTRTEVGFIAGKWEDFVRKGKRRPGLKRSLARTLGLDAEEVTREDCVKRIFQHALQRYPLDTDGRVNIIFRGVIQELFPSAKSRGNPKQLANEDPGWLCEIKKSGVPPAEKFFRNNQGLFDFMDRLFRADSNEKLKLLSRMSIQESCLSGVEQAKDSNEEEGDSEEATNTDNASEEFNDVNSEAEEDDFTEYLVGEDAVQRLNECYTKATELLCDQSFRDNFLQLTNGSISVEAELARLGALVATKQKEEEDRLIFPRFC